MCVCGALQLRFALLFRILRVLVHGQNIRLEGKSEENFCLELNNGWICCTVRADMAKAVAQMLELHRSGKKLDGIIIETTGMANPAPVVQTFFADKALSNGVFLDGVITVVDAKHISMFLFCFFAQSIKSKHLEHRYAS